MKTSAGKAITIVVCVLFCAAYVSATFLYKGFSADTASTFITFFAIIAVFAIVQKRRKWISSDEFTVVQDLKSFRNSWLVTLLAIMVISNLDYFDLYSFPMDRAVGLIMVVMVLSFWIFHFIYLRKPDAR